MSKSIKLLCDTNQMAYGSSSALLAILDYLNTENSAFVFGITSEILSTDRNIHHKINIDNKNTELVTQTIDKETFDAVLVVSNLNNISTYIEKKLPVFYVDLHHWYPSEKTHRVWVDAKKCFIEKFFVENKQIPENSVEVNPLIRANNILYEKEKLILVNIGGGENRWIVPGVHSNYLFLIFDLLKDVLIQFSDYKVVIAAGKKSVATLNNFDIPNNLSVDTFPQNKYLNLLNKAEYLFTSPGLNAVYEGMYYGAKLIFLPPQNASQVIQLKVYEDVNLVEWGINLTCFYKDFKSLQDKELNEEKLTQEVLRALKTIESNGANREIIKTHIQQQLKSVNTSDYYSKIAALNNNIGKSGAKTVAQYISKWFENEENN